MSKDFSFAFFSEFTANLKSIRINLLNFNLIFMRKILIVSICLFLSACSNDLVPQDEIQMLNNSNLPTTENVETMQTTEPPATGTNFTRNNDFIDSSLDQVDDYANQLNQQMDKMEQFK